MEQTYLKRENRMDVHRTRLIMAVMLLLAICSSASSTSFAQHRSTRLLAPASLAAPPLTETEAERDQRMKWWREARFGMFIHWGLYSVPAGVWKGEQSKHIGEWLMLDYKIPVA